MIKLKKEMQRFIIVGLSAVGTDLLTYYVLINFFSHNASKVFSFIAGSILAFIMNKYWTFEKHEKNYSEIWKFGCLYLSTLGANVLTNGYILDVTNLVFLSFLIATGVSTVLNFLGQKFWVFK